MSDRLEIVVKQEHIDAGVREQPWACAVALSLREKGYVPWVSMHEVRADGRRYILSLELRDFISDFDSGKTVYPERFVLQPVREPAAAPVATNSAAD